ncbi:MAG: MGMT family protein [Patescibacteria group bacterium]|nr:MGMT family protein [Patescibacteria group bacterium]MDD5715555.1 MGMT family protein [Patescibacteria group bacterium]
MAYSYFQRVYGLVKRIPRGRVATYGQIAGILGSPRGARMVGWALHVLPKKELRTVPWHRVINREGRISTTCLEHTARQQAELLKKERVAVTAVHGSYRIDLTKFLWKPF